MKLKHLAVLLALSTIAADCPFGDSSNSTGTDASAVVGSWTLQSVNGDPLPASFDDNGNTVQITAGSATINANNTFTYSETWDGSQDVTNGTWAKDGNTYVFTPNAVVGEVQVPGYVTVSGNTMTLTVNDGGTIVRILARN